jgi:hypothetical protein
MRISNPLLALEGRIPGLVISQVSGLTDAIGETVTTQRLSTGSISSYIRGDYNFLQFGKNFLVVLDDTVYHGDLNHLDKNSITDAIFLDKADAIPLYGSSANNGVLIISTKGKIQWPLKARKQVIKVRRNFNETAFFSPNVHMDKNGLYSFTFTLPESLTEWKWLLLAHTQQGRFAYAERKLST